MADPDAPMTDGDLLALASTFRIVPIDEWRRATASVAASDVSTASATASVTASSTAGMTAGATAGTTAGTTPPP